MHAKKSLHLIALQTVFVVLLGILSPKISAQEDLFKTTLKTYGGSSKNVFFVEYSYSPTSYIFLGKTPYSSSYRTSLGFISANSFQIFSTRFNYSARLHPILGYTYSKRDEGGKLVNVDSWSLDPLGLSSVIQLNRTATLEIPSMVDLRISYTFPTDKGRRLNYNFEIQTTIEQVIAKRCYISFGGGFHHISNAQTGEQNPGIDSIYLLLRLSYLVQ